MLLNKTCENCSDAFQVRGKYASQKYCSRECMFTYESNNGRAAARLPDREFVCKECGKKFYYKPSQVKAYVTKHGKEPPYCSIPCSAIGRRKDADERHKTNCKNCGKEFYRTRRKGSGTIYHTQELCNKQCKNEWVSKQYHASRGTAPQITRRVKRRYVELRIPANNGNPVRHVLEHRYIMEQQLGRELLPEETVHHINGIKTDNRPENLELFSSRHGPGQRVVDKVRFALEILHLYPQISKQMINEMAAKPPSPDHEPTDPL